MSDRAYRTMLLRFRYLADCVIFVCFRFHLLAWLNGETVTFDQYKYSLAFLCVCLTYTLFIIGRGFVKMRMAAYGVSLFVITALHILMHFLGISSATRIPVLHHFVNYPLTFDVLITVIGHATQFATERCLYERQMRQEAERLRRAVEQLLVEFFARPEVMLALRAMADDVNPYRGG